MDKFWRSAQALKTAATVLLLLALIVIAGVHLCSQKAVAIQGPGVMQVIGPDRVWLGVNQDLWVLDAAGHKLAQKTAQELGLSRAVSNIAPAPDGQVLLTARDQPSWVVVRGADLAPVGTIAPQWPQDIQGNISNAIRVAVSPTWDIAVATGGGHTVLLFDKNGKLKARTHPGAYNFTNGLWHSPEGWWTTDTNRFVLRLLDSETLAEKKAIRLQPGMGLRPFLAEMAPSRGAALAAGSPAPLATLSRLDFLMDSGDVVDVFADGTQVTYNQGAPLRMQGIGWLRDDLLVVDAGNYQVLRFSNERKALPPFGDAQVQADLSQMREQRQFWSQLSSRYMFALGASLLLLGMAAYSRHKKMLVQAQVVQRQSIMTGTPELGKDPLVRQWLWVIAWPVLVRSIVAFGSIFGLPAAVLMVCSRYGIGRPLNLLLTLTIVMLPVFLAALWQQQRLQRFSLKPGYEAMLNRQAVAWLLKHSDWDDIRQDGEAPRETLLLRSAGLGWRRQWLLITNQRVLLFAASLHERRLLNEWPRSTVLFAGTPEQEQPHRGILTRLTRWLMPQVNLRIRLRTGEVITGVCPSAVTAARAASLLMRGRPTQTEPIRQAPAQRRGRRWHQVLASLALPGSGQWLQERFVSGTIYFTVAVLLFMGMVGPLLWAMTGPKMEVGSLSKLSTLYVWLLLAAISSLDAWQFAGARQGTQARVTR
ncbi:MAG: hypothetical protein M3R45_08775 [Pseudomonadota bacterium]|nr:hypothetical protein [Pseudomonadota bacterium]